MIETQYEKLLWYSLGGEKLGEEFFSGQLRSLRDSIEERRFQIELRTKVHYEILEEIQEERVHKESQLRSLASSYSGERLTMMKQIEALSQEARAEKVRLVKDVAQFSKEERQKLEEYDEVAQTFRMAAISQRGGGNE